MEAERQGRGKGEQKEAKLPGRGLKGAHRDWKGRKKLIKCKMRLKGH